MKITWYGMGCFLLESVEGIKVLTDPYDASTGYKIPRDAPDIVTVSHGHFDHSAVETVRGQPLVISERGNTFEYGINFTGVKTFHDKKQGKERGENTVFVIKMDNINFIHLGDIGHELDFSLLQALGPCDILALPVGGIFTIADKTAAEIVSQLSPSLVIPMHYTTPSCRLDLNTEEKFTCRYPEVRRIKKWEGSRADFPSRMQVIVMRAKGEKGI